MKKIYERPTIKINAFDSADVLTNSPVSPEGASQNGFYGLEKEFDWFN